MTGPVRPALRLAVADEDQVMRLAAFRAGHPDVVIEDLGFGGVWQARFHDPDGETTITRHMLCQLLDKLDSLLGPR